MCRNFFISNSAFLTGEEQPARDEWIVQDCFLPKQGHGTA